MLKPLHRHPSAYSSNPSIAISSFSMSSLQDSQIVRGETFLLLVHTAL
jgi:hypothetical protein